MSEAEEEVVPLNTSTIVHPNSQNTNFQNSEIENQSKEPILLNSVSLEVNDVQIPLRTMELRRSNSVKRDPPKILVNRVPPAGIGKCKA